MKYHLLLTVFLGSFFLISCKNSSAQITVAQDDFANSGDMVRLSVAVWNPLLDYKTTGVNSNWDFSDLQWQSQYVDTFLNPLFTNPMYAFAFSNLPINPYRSNIGKCADNILTTLPLLSSIFTEGYNFYYKSSSGYKQRGMGMKVSGFPTPVPMAHCDTIYKFPMNFSDENSSWSDYMVHVPQLGTYLHKQHRVNTVDGWGTLITPFGTFDVLRQVSEIRGSDSLYIDTLNFGFKINNDIQREYKWIGNEQKEPLLQINTQAGILGLFPNFEFVTKIVYRDSLRFLPTGTVNSVKDEVPFQIFPNPSTGSFYISVPTDLTSTKITITDVSGKMMLMQEMNGSIEQINTATWAKGIYILTIQSSKGTASKKLVIE